MSYAPDIPLIHFYDITMNKEQEHEAVETLRQVNIGCREIGEEIESLSDNYEICMEVYDSEELCTEEYGTISCSLGPCPSANMTFLSPRLCVCTFEQANKEKIFCITPSKVVTEIIYSD